MEISKLTPGEWEQYKQLRLEALKEDGTAFGESYAESSQRSDEEWQRRLTNPKNHIMVARDGDRLFAMAGACQEEGEKVRHIAYAWGVYVNKDYRGKGVGKKLMEALLEEVRKNNEIEKVNLNVNTIQQSAVKLYEKLGFEIVGTLHKELKIGDKYFDEHAMEKFLR